MPNKSKLYKALPLGCASSISKTDARHKRWNAQRAAYGWDETELWNLDTTIARFILPRLKSFKTQQLGYPNYFHIAKGITKKEGARWTACLNRMIAAFELLANGIDWDSSPEGRETVRLGLNDFRDFFANLWN